MRLFSWLFKRRRKPAYPPSEWWIAPSPDADTYIGLPNAPVQIYQGNVINFNNGSSFPDVSKLPQGLAVEVPVIKPWNVVDGVIDVQMTIDLALETQKKIEAAGNYVAWWTMDEPFTGAGMVNIGAHEAIEATRTWIAAMASTGAQIALIEAFPHWSIEIINTMARSIPIDALHLDVDVNDARKRKINPRVLQTITQEVPLCALLWGWDERSPKHFIDTAKDLLNYYRDGFGDEWPRRLIVQSWMRGLPTSILVDVYQHARKELL